MTRRLLHLAILLGLVMYVNTIHADTVLAIYMGTSSPCDSDLHIVQESTNSDATFTNIHWRSESFREPIYYGLRIHHFFDQKPEWGWGLDFTHDKLIADPEQVTHVEGVWNGAPVSETAPLKDRVQRFEMTHGLNTLGLNVLHRWHEHGDLQPYVGVGPTLYVPHPENRVNQQGNDQHYDYAGLGYQALGGLSYDVTSRIGLFVEYKYNSGKPKVDIAGGYARTKSCSNQLLWGLNFGL